MPKASYSSLSEEDKATRRILFHPCKDEQHLKDFLYYFFNLELPDFIVDPDSNTTPFGLVWEIYSLALSGGDELKSRIMAYAARASMKTLDAAILEVLVILHAKRDVVHLAAQEDQSDKAQEYVRNFLDIPSLRPFIEGDRKRTLEVLRYESIDNPTENLTKDEYLQLTQQEQERYTKVHLKIEVAICTLAGTNSKHSTFMVVDEVDVISNPRAYQEAKSIPKGRNGQLPITLLISTRKSSYGKVQEELDKAHKTGLVVRHWNLLDVTERCPDKKHLPLLPKLDVYIDRSALTTISENEFKDLPITKQQKFERTNVFAGCVTCPLVSACRGTLAGQKSQAKMLSQLSDTVLTIRDAGDPDYVNAQYLCTKPNSEGLIYPRLDMDLHTVTLAQFYEAQLKQKYNGIDIDAFVKLFVEEYGARVGLGIDFGHTHPFAATLALLLPEICLFFRALEIPSLEEQEQIEICKEKYQKYDPIVWADMAMPGAIKAFKKAGFRIRLWKKGPGSVLDGINIIRSKLRPVSGEPQMFFLKEGEGVMGLVSRLAKYHRARDASGRLTDDPEKKDDDLCDAARYLTMNAYPLQNSEISVSQTSKEDTGISVTHTDLLSEQDQRQRHWREQVMQQIGAPRVSTIVGNSRIKIVS